MKILFTKRAEAGYHAIKDYMQRRWGEKVSEAFEQKTTDFLNLLEDYPKIGNTEVPEKQIYGFQLTKKTKVFYRIKPNEIIVLVFFDGRQSPKKKPR